VAVERSGDPKDLTPAPGPLEFTAEVVAFGACEIGSAAVKDAEKIQPLRNLQNESTMPQALLKVHLMSSIPSFQTMNEQQSA